MANYHTHISVSTALGAAYGSVAIWFWDQDWGPAFLGAGLTALGGMLPDLDSDSGVPVREMFGMAAAIIPAFLSRVILLGFENNYEKTFVVLGAIYLFIRYVVSGWFKRVTVHRGIFHSIPAMFISGMIIYLTYRSPDRNLRIYLAVGTMLGFLSHLVLDEIYSVDFNGFRVQLNNFAGSALKFYSRSWVVNSVCYLMLFGLAAMCIFE